MEVRRPIALAGFVAAFLAMGSVPPMPTPEGTILAWMVGQAVMVGLGFWVVLRRRVPAG